ncbi:MAG: aminotransferase class IV, partial [Candidatus Omnitrophica bacterium]|nr:aminotransferase class IV [Candidatus Omnitrophota bacterium]
MTDNTSTYPDFGLIETILWEQGSYFLLPLHFERLEKSAVFFGFRYDKKPLLQSLEKNSHIFNPEEKYRVRL